MGERALPKEGNNDTAPVSEVFLHFLRLEADWKVELPPLHQMERELVWIVWKLWSKNLGFLLQKKSKHITGISCLPLCSFQYLNKFHSENNNSLISQ